MAQLKIEWSPARQRVTATYWHPDFDEMVTKTFTCPVAGGRVVEIDDRGESRPVAEKLAVRGPVLWSPSREALPDVVRAEYADWLRSANVSARNRAPARRA